MDHPVVRWSSAYLALAVEWLFLSGRVGKQTLANLLILLAAAVDAIETVLKGKTLVDAEAVLRTRWPDHELRCSFWFFVPTVEQLPRI
jgi:hypothetical protein